MAGFQLRLLLIAVADIGATAHAVRVVVLYNQLYGRPRDRERILIPTLFLRVFGLDPHSTTPPPSLRLGSEKSDRSRVQ